MCTHAVPCACRVCGGCAVCVPCVCSGYALRSVRAVAAWWLTSAPSWSSTTRDPSALSESRFTLGPRPSGFPFFLDTLPLLADFFSFGGMGGGSVHHLSKRRARQLLNRGVKSWTRCGNLTGKRLTKAVLLLLTQSPIWPRYRGQTPVRDLLLPRKARATRPTTPPRSSNQACEGARAAWVFQMRHDLPLLMKRAFVSSDTNSIVPSLARTLCIEQCSRYLSLHCESSTLRSIL